MNNLARYLQSVNEQPDSKPVPAHQPQAVPLRPWEVALGILVVFIASGILPALLEPHVMAFWDWVARALH